jgi:predicted membrane protein
MKLNIETKNRLVRFVDAASKALAWLTIVLLVGLIAAGAYGVTHQKLSTEVFEQALGVWMICTFFFCAIGFWPHKRPPTKS